MKFSSARYLQKVLLPLVLLLFLGGFGAYNLIVGRDPDFAMMLACYPKADVALAAQHVPQLHAYLFQSIGFLGEFQLGLFLIFGLLGWRNLLVLKLHVAAAAAQVILHVLRWLLDLRIIGIFIDAEIIKSGKEPDPAMLWTMHTLVLLAVVALSLAWGVIVFLRETHNIYSLSYEVGPLWGDRVLDDLRRHGDDPPMRQGWYVSWTAHLSLVILPLIIAHFHGCIKPYDVPEGDGIPAAAVKVVKVEQKKKKKKQRLILDMNSAIIFHIPEIDESKIFEELDEATSQTYVADNLSAVQEGAMGAGGKGTRAGWKGGKGSKVRFIRLKYRGGDWDQNMGLGADYNFLIKFSELSKLGIADNTEANEITQLGLYPKGRAPPFVYITGKGNIDVSANEIKVLRKYLLTEGGMIFADNGGGHFNGSFRNLMARVVPELPMVVISHDDIIYRQPFVFPDGSPPLWHHSGTEAMGVKYEGRWICFYHQGDLNDAWQTGHSGSSKEKAYQAYKMGVNVVYYAFTQYIMKHHNK